jgi:capsid protein
VVPLRPSANTGWNATGSTYEGASLGRRTIGWNPGNESVNSALFRASDTLRARSRDMIRKNAWANNGSEVFVSEAIGTGIKPQSQHTDAATKEDLQKLWTKWTDYCDAHGTSDFYGLQALAVRSMMEGGECFIRLRYRKASDGLDIPLQLQLLESEHCPSTLNRTEDNGNVTKYGIEFDQIGRRVAYWMYPEHPGEYPITGNPNLSARPGSGFAGPAHVPAVASRAGPGRAVAVPSADSTVRLRPVHRRGPGGQEDRGVIRGLHHGVRSG